MTPTKAVLNDYCREQQRKALESQAKASKITVQQAEAQARFILTHGDKGEPVHQWGE